MTEVLFYHLERQSLEDALPRLLEACLERKWRVVLQVGSTERCEALDGHLWTYRDESFLPHSMRRDGNEKAQPIWLTTGDDRPNDADVRFLVDGAKAAALDGYQRIVFMFDGDDSEALTGARAAWSEARSAGHDVTYWQQNPAGRWEKKA